MTSDDVLRVAQIELVDPAGVPRMTLAAVAPNPVMDGAELERVAPFSGIIVRDEHGNERGGLGYLGEQDGRVVWALDHRTIDAVGTVVAPDGSVMQIMNQAPRHEGEDGAARTAHTRLHLKVAADGSPEIALSDSEGRTRLRLTVTDDGAGALA
jgi:hypothetical protein